MAKTQTILLNFLEPDTVVTSHGKILYYRIRIQQITSCSNCFTMSYENNTVMSAAMLLAVLLILSFQRISIIYLG